MIIYFKFKFELKLFLLFIMMMADTQYFTLYASIPLDVTVCRHKTLIRLADKGSHLNMMGMVMVVLTIKAVILETKV